MSARDVPRIDVEVFALPLKDRLVLAHALVPERAIREMWGKANFHITPPAVVAALVEALEEAGKFIADYEGMVGLHSSVGVSIRAALALYREAGR